MNNIDELLDSLQGQQPIIMDEDAFIDGIMDRLPEMEEVEPSDERTSPIIIMLRTFSSIAATLLIGLFIYLNVDNTADAQQAATEGCYMIRKDSYYSDLSKCTTPEEAIRQYAERKQRSINNLISMYNEKDI